MAKFIRQQRPQSDKTRNYIQRLQKNNSKGSRVKHTMYSLRNLTRSHWDKRPQIRDGIAS